MFLRAVPIFDMWSGHTSGQLVYPKKRSVTYPSVFNRESNVSPDVVLRVNLGFGKGGVTNPPRYVAALSFGPWAAARSLVPSERARITEHVQKNRGFIWNNPKLMSIAPQGPTATQRPFPPCLDYHADHRCN